MAARLKPKTVAEGARSSVSKDEISARPQPDQRGRDGWRACRPYRCGATEEEHMPGMTYAAAPVALARRTSSLLRAWM